MPIFALNDNAIVLQDLYDPWALSGAGDFIVSGTVTAQIYELDGVTPIGAAISLTYFAQRAGVTGHWWMGGIEEDVALTVGDEVLIDVQADAGTDRIYRLPRRRERVLERTS